MKKVKSDKSNARKTSKNTKKTKGHQTTISQPETVIEFVWSDEVAKARTRMKKQLQTPFVGEMPPIAGVKNHMEDIWISQLALMYSSIIQDRKYNKLLKERQDPCSMKCVIRNFCSPVFFEKRDTTKIVKSEKEEIKEVSGDQKEDIKVSSKELDKQQHKNQVEQKRKGKNKNQATEEIKDPNQIVKSEEQFKPWRVCIPCPNIFPGLYLTPSVMSLISEPMEEVIKQNELPEVTGKKHKKDRKLEKREEEKKSRNKKQK